MRILVAARGIMVNIWSMGNKMKLFRHRASKQNMGMRIHVGAGQFSEETAVKFVILPTKRV